MNTEQTTQVVASGTTPAGYEPREVIWPGTEERFTALFPVAAQVSVSE